MVVGLSESGFCRFGYDPDLVNWVDAAHRPALAAVADPEKRSRWLVCEGTWFVGVDALNNDARGSIGRVPLLGEPVRQAQALFGALDLHKAQVSVVWPGYPRPREGESAAGFRYRKTRDAAHLDGVKAVGADRCRRIDETHAWILGIPLNEAGPGASPLVVWRGSQEVMRRALLAELRDVPEAEWGEVDVTDAYQAARREVFERCERVELVARPGEAYLLHRLCLHGVAPWREGPAEGRWIAYFRPEMPGGVGEWLRLP